MPRYPFASGPGEAFHYDPASRVATWRLAQAIGNDRVALELDADPGGVTAPGGGPRLDGDWANDGTDTYPSGDDEPGGDFVFRLNVHPGDVNGTGGSVNSVDVVAVRNRQFTSTSNPGTAPDTYDVFHDVNGSGNINSVDVVAARNRVFTSLPGPNLTAAVADLGGGVRRDKEGQPHTLLVP